MALRDCRHPAFASSAPPAFEDTIRSYPRLFAALALALARSAHRLKTLPGPSWGLGQDPRMLSRLRVARLLCVGRNFYGWSVRWPVCLRQAPKKKPRLCSRGFRVFPAPHTGAFTEANKMASCHPRKPILSAPARTGSWCRCRSCAPSRPALTPSAFW